jgi:putative spermidine/putrescine transport system permease protein
MLRLSVALVVVFLAMPNVAIIASSFSPTSTFGLWNGGLSLQWYENLFSRPTFGSGTLNSLILAIGSTVAGTAVGLAAAVAIARWRFPGRNLLNAFVMAPLVVPEVVIGLSMLIGFATIKADAGMVQLAALHTIIVLPYTTRILLANLQRTDPSLEAAARLLGATPLKAFLLVTLPIIGKGLAGAMIFAFVTSFHNFTATFFLVSNEATLPVAIFQYIRTEHDPTVAALSTLMMAGAMLLVWLLDRLLGLEKAVR